MASTSRRNSLQEDDAEEEVCHLLNFSSSCVVFMDHELYFSGATFRWFHSCFILGKVLHLHDSNDWFQYSPLIQLLFRFISDIEATCRQWLADGPKNLVVRLLFQNVLIHLWSIEFYSCKWTLLSESSMAKALELILLFWCTMMELDVYCWIYLSFVIVFWAQEKGAVTVEDSKNLFKVKYDLKNVTKSYCMEFYFQIDDNGSQQGVYDYRVIGRNCIFFFMIWYLTDAAGVDNWNTSSHDLQLCFGVKDFLVRFKSIVSALLHILIFDWLFLHLLVDCATKCQWGASWYTGV